MSAQLPAIRPPRGRAARLSHWLALLVLLVAASPGQSQLLATGAIPPPLRIEALGEVILADGEFQYTPWESNRGLGRVQVFQHLAATPSARDIHKPFTDALEREMPDGDYLFTSVVNLDEAIWGTRSMAVREVRKNKRKYWQSIMVLDEQGRLRDQWQLAAGGSSLMVLDRDGKLLYFTEQAIPEDRHPELMEIISAAIAADNDPRHAGRDPVLPLPPQTTP